MITRRVFSMLVLISTSVVGADPLIVDVPALRGKSQSEVALQLGTPRHCTETYQGTACDYGEEIEVVFRDDRVYWIQVTPKSEIDFEPAALRSIGLLPALPTVRNPFRMHWDGHQGFDVISVYGSGRYVALFRIEVVGSR